MKNYLVGLVLAGLTLSIVPVASAAGDDDKRTNANKKGSLLIYSKWEIRWDDAGNLVQDTFFDLTNDFDSSVIVQMYFINGDAPLAADPVSGERAHPGWNNFDFKPTLTANQPNYWSALSGAPRGVTPLTVLDPGAPPGRPDPEGSTDRVLRGYALMWAVNGAEQEIRHNHLKGDALLLNYRDGTAWEYNAWSFQIYNVAQGQQSGTPGVLNLDGAEYDYAPGRLLLNFYASGSTPFVGAPAIITVDTDLTLHAVSVDLRQDTEGPVTTKAVFDIYDQNENQHSGTEKCITCWDQSLLSSYGIPNHFLREFLQTDKGKARIDGVGSQVCEGSISAALLGVQAKFLDFDNGQKAVAGGELHVQNIESAVVYYDVAGGAGEGNTGRTPKAKKSAGTP